jgi:hypothetical protein
LFAIRPLKPLLPQQLFDSAVTALRSPELTPGRRAFVNAAVARTFGEDFSSYWGYRERVVDLLFRLNRDLPLQSGSTDELYWRFLGRRPSEAELQMCRDRTADDIAFALLHSNEFTFNH